MVAATVNEPEPPGAIVGISLGFNDTLYSLGLITLISLKNSSF